MYVDDLVRGSCACRAFVSSGLWGPGIPSEDRDLCASAVARFQVHRCVFGGLCVCVCVCDTVRCTARGLGWTQPQRSMAGPCGLRGGQGDGGEPAGRGTDGGKAQNWTGPAAVPSLMRAWGSGHEAENAQSVVLAPWGLLWAPSTRFPELRRGEAVVRREPRRPPLPPLPCWCQQGLVCAGGRAVPPPRHPGLLLPPPGGFTLCTWPFPT